MKELVYLAALFSFVKSQIHVLSPERLKNSFENLEINYYLLNFGDIPYGLNEVIIN